MKAPLAQATTVARIGALGMSYGIDAMPLLEKFAPFSDELTRNLRIAVPHAFDRIAVGTRIATSGDGLERLRVMCGADIAAVASELAGTARKDLGLELELTTTGAIEVALYALGARDVEADLAAMARLGASATAIDTTRPMIAALGGELAGLSARSYADTRGWALRLVQHNATPDETTATCARITTVGEQLGATLAQRNLIGNIHDMLAKGAPTSATLRASSDRLERELTVGWPAVSWNSLVRIMTNLYPKADAGNRLGELAGVFDAIETAALELVLGPSEPPGLRIAVEVHA